MVMVRLRPLPGVLEAPPVLAARRATPAPTVSMTVGLSRCLSRSARLAQTLVAGEATGPTSAESDATKAMTLPADERAATSLAAQWGATTRQVLTAHRDLAPLAAAVVCGRLPSTEE